MARAFKPKSKILGRYFKESPYGLKEISKLLEKPLYEYSHEFQHRIVIVLLLINKREENLIILIQNIFNKIDTRTLLLDVLKMEIKDNYKKRMLSLIGNFISDKYSSKELISMIKGMSDKKREIIIDHFFGIKTVFFNPRSEKRNLDYILTLKDKYLDSFKKSKLLDPQYMNAYEKRSDKMNINKVSGRVKNISFSILDKNDTRSLYLDDYSDCCQGLNNAGEECMMDGISNEDAGFLVFERRGIIFAQGWIRKVDENTLLIDSIEFKGDFNESLIESINASVKALSRQFEHIYMGLSPNRRDLISYFPSKGKKIFTRTESSSYTLSRIFNFANNAKIYSDAKNNIIKLN